MSVYERHFKLHDEPFRLTPDPRYLFLSQKHREVLAHLQIGTSESGGFVCITGDVGTGKTTIIRSFLDQLESGTPYAYIFNPPQSPLELLQTINSELGLSSTERSRKALVDALNTFLLAERRAGRRTLVVVDEAQALSPEVLEELRLLSNLETATAKLLQIVLFGQPQLADVLRSADLAQLNQRITLRWHLGALNGRETAAYVRHRLRVAAGGVERAIFSSRSLARIHGYSGGVPRLINILCHRGLLAAYAAENPCVTTRMVERVHDEIQRVPLLGNPKRTANWRRIAWGAGGAALAATLAWALILTGLVSPDVRPTPPAVDAPQQVARNVAASPDPTRSGHPEAPGRLATKDVAEPRATTPPEWPDAAEENAALDVAVAQDSIQSENPEALDVSERLATKDVAEPRTTSPPEWPDAAEEDAALDVAVAQDPTEREWPDFREHLLTEDVAVTQDPGEPERPEVSGRLAMITADTSTPPPLPATIPFSEDRPQNSGGEASKQVSPGVARRSVFEVARMLLARTEAASTTAAVETILQLWGERPLAPHEMGVPMDLDEIAARRDLYHLSISGTVSMLRVLNLPAILELVMPGAVGPRYAVLSGVDADTCLLTLDGRVITVERSFLDEYWLGQAHVVWRDFEGLSPTFRKGSTGPRVGRLQQMLAQLTFYTGPITGTFDDETEIAVAAFQRSHRLFADAIVGRLTRIVLYNALGDYDQPRLTARNRNGSGADA